ncbi:endo alpha-1,4 polygalactosaminidase [Vibrio sp. AK197]
MHTHKFTFIASLLSLLLLMGCGSDSQGSASQFEILTPITGGNWYQPASQTTWQWQLKDTINSSYEVAVYDIDLFDTSTSDIKALQADGHKVICYFSAGSFEDWREDATSFADSVLGDTLDGWEDERWLDISAESVREIMHARLELAQRKGCDGVEPDNVDGYTNNSGFNLSYHDQLMFNRYIANTAHQLGLSVGLKNDLDQITDLVDYFDFAVNEQCFEYNECGYLAPFIAADKAVFNAEYESTYVDSTSSRNALCDDANQRKFSTLILPLDLDDRFRYSCLNESD